jgi:molybdopterin/thiamine biosynthesis adenylyltransferase
MQTQTQSNRFKGAAWFPQHDEMVMIGGAGGIGSWLAFFLARAGFKPMLYDFDTVEEHNLGGQLFRQADVGSPKVTAVYNIINEFVGEQINISTEAINTESPTHHFVFSAFDNMQARKDLFEIWQKSIPGCSVTPLFIDGRLEMEQLQIFCVTPDRIEQYKEHLFNDSDVEDTECTARQTTHTAAMIASHMTGFFTNHIANIYERQTVRDLPFYYEFFIPASFTQIE